MSTRSQGDTRDNSSSKFISRDDGCEADDSSILSTGAPEVEDIQKDRAELISLKEQVADLQSKLLEKDEALKSMENSLNHMNSVRVMVDELKQQVEEKDSMIKSAMSQLSSLKVLQFKTFAVRFSLFCDVSLHVCILSQRFIFGLTLMGIIFFAKILILLWSHLRCQQHTLGTSLYIEIAMTTASLTFNRSPLKQLLQALNSLSFDSKRYAVMLCDVSDRVEVSPELCSKLLYVSYY